MKKVYLVIITSLFVSFCTKESPTGSNKISFDWEDTVGLFVDSVTVNHQLTDTLSLAYDDTTCDSLAVVRVYLSRYPEYKINSLCNMVFFDNYDNNRYECYTCKQLSLCNSNDSTGYLSMDKVFGKDTIIQNSESGQDTFFKEETTCIITIRVLKLDSLNCTEYWPDLAHAGGCSTLGEDIGSVSVHIDNLFDKIISDTTMLNTTFHLYWDER